MPLSSLPHPTPPRSTAPRTPLHLPPSQLIPLYLPPGLLSALLKPSPCNDSSLIMCAVAAPARGIHRVSKACGARQGGRGRRRHCRWQPPPHSTRSSPPAGMQLPASTRRRDYVTRIFPHACATAPCRLASVASGLLPATRTDSRNSSRRRSLLDELGFAFSDASAELMEWTASTSARLAALRHNPKNDAMRPSGAQMHEPPSASSHRLINRSSGLRCRSGADFSQIKLQPGEVRGRLWLLLIACHAPPASVQAKTMPPPRLYRSPSSRGKPPYKCWTAA